jgi:1-acyl-sn-glycerol-3-phosphate acyltransferase
LAWLVAALLLPTGLVWLLGLLLPSGRAMRRVERAFLRLALLVGGLRTRVRGTEHVSGAQRFVIVSNHASYADIAALDAMLPLDFLYVAKREVLGWPLIGLYIRKAGHLTVERFDTRESAADADKLKQAVQAGHSVLVFPEGTFTAASGLRPFRLGAFKAAAEAGIAVLPVVLRGTRRVLPDGVWVPRRGPLDLEILPPIHAEGAEWREVVGLRDRVAQAIAERCGEPRLDMLAGAPPVRPAGP